jgi:hypothetical protein
MVFSFKGDCEGLRKYEVQLKGIEELQSFLPTFRHLLENAKRDNKVLEVKFITLPR